MTVVVTTSRTCFPALSTPRASLRRRCDMLWIGGTVEWSFHPWMDQMSGTSRWVGLEVRLSRLQLLLMRYLMLNCSTISLPLSISLFSLSLSISISLSLCLCFSVSFSLSLSVCPSVSLSLSLSLSLSFSLSLCPSSLSSQEHARLKQLYDAEDCWYQKETVELPSPVSDLVHSAERNVQKVCV